MKATTRRWILLAALLIFVLLLVSLLATAPKHPVALIRIVDSATNPVPGAVVLPEGLRTKPGPYVSGWYSWTADRLGVTNSPVITDREGYARVPYPKYVFEQIETGTLCLSVNHPDYVPQRPESRVALAPPAGAPWRAWLNYFRDRIQHKVPMARSDPVVLQKGAILEISIPSWAAMPAPARLFAQASGAGFEDTNLWVSTRPGQLITRRLSPGPHTVRAVRLDTNGSVWFSDVLEVALASGQTNELVMSLKPGGVVRGQLDAVVPRPVKRGRVVANVWPTDCKPQDQPPQWHDWAPVQEDGSFAFDSLPQGNLEIVALCNGFVSTNGPGQFHFRYPQHHSLGTNDLAITVGMEPTARLEVTVTDEDGHPLKNAHVTTWPNVRYGEWGAVILMADCYKTADVLLQGQRAAIPPWQGVSDFEGRSDNDGVAVLENLPADVSQLNAEHPQFVLPAIGTSAGRKERNLHFTLVPGQTNRVSVQLERRDKAPIRHY